MAPGPAAHSRPAAKRNAEERPRGAGELYAFCQVLAWAARAVAAQALDPRVFVARGVTGLPRRDLAFAARALHRHIMPEDGGRVDTRRRCRFGTNKPRWRGGRRRPVRSR